MRKTIIRLEQTDSTNRYLREHGAAGEGMTVVVAGYQTAGRGQGTNTWESEPGKNLLMSILWTPKEEESLPSAASVKMSMGRLFLFSEAGALAVGRALASYTDGITLKWPNDIYWKDNKISGTLIETAVGGRGLRSCLYGVGINVNQTVFRSDAPNPVSLAQILGHEVDVEEVMQRVLDAFDQEITTVSEGRAEEVSRRYHASLYRRTGYHLYRDGEGPFEAEIVRVEDDGHLMLCDSASRIRRYAFKEVEFILPAT